MTTPENKTVVLIVDDDTNNLRLLGLILRDAGYEALAVRDPEKVLSIIKAKAPELVLLDVSMPKMNGYDVCKQILKEPGLERLPVIFLTARTEPEDLIRGFNTGAVDYVTKPFNKTELLARMRNHIERCRYEKSLAGEKERFRVLTESVNEAFILIGGLEPDPVQRPAVSAMPSPEGGEQVATAVSTASSGIPVTPAASGTAAGFPAEQIQNEDPSGTAVSPLQPGTRRIEYVSPAFIRMFGFTPPDESADLDFLENYIRTEDLSSLRDLLTRTARDKISGNIELEFTRPDGVSRWAWIRTTYSTLAGDPKLICVAADITEKKVAELQIFRAHEVSARLAGETRKSLGTYEKRLRGLGIDSGLLSIACREIDGDFLDIFINRDTVDVVVGDVMGKGIHAALVSSGARTWFLRSRFRAGTGKTGLPSASAMVAEVDRAMAGHLIKLNSFFTAQYIRIHRTEGYMEFVDCGHTPILVWNGEDCWAFKGSNTPIGFLEGQKFITHRMPFGPGSVFLVYSDGVTDTVDPEGESFGEDRLREALARYSTKTAPDIVASMKQELENFASGAKWKDDITLAAFRLSDDPPVPAPRYSNSFVLPSSIDCLGEVREYLQTALDCYDEEEMNETNRSLAILAVNEAAANIIIHGLKRIPAKSFQYTIEVHDSWYSITFTYPGPDFEWTKTKKSSVINLDESGYGMDIMQDTMYSVLFARNSLGVARFILTGLPGGNEEIDEYW